MPNTNVIVAAELSVVPAGKCEDMAVDAVAADELAATSSRVSQSQQFVVPDEVVVVAEQAEAENGVIRTVQTQHGDFRTVDEENIVVLVRCHSPEPPGTDEECVWIQADAFGRDPVEVSTFKFVFTEFLLKRIQ